MSIPKIVERKIVHSVKPGNYKQYTITLPKEYAEELERRGIDSLFIVFNFGLGAFPKFEGFTEKALLTFMQKHPELQQLFSQIKTENQKEEAGVS